ncbi:hypothetical protein G6F57_014499 [Rhizopus arrhizus]|nr:hypothetical protein G6F57_014499 [Rhizopus arrhizus]
MLNPLWLKTFAAAAAAPSFTEAARRLGLTQPTVSEHVRQLEQAVNRRLFLRDTHSLTLTSDGRSLLVHAEIILDAHERAERLFDAPRLRGRVRLDLARRRDGAGDRLRRNGGDRRAVGADRVVAGVSARQRTADIHQLADGSILVREGARRRQRNGVALDHAVERARRIGGSGAVIGLAGGRDGARQGLGRDVGQRRGVGAQLVVARVGAGQDTVHRHQLAVAHVLVAEQARGIDGDVVALHHAVQRAGGGGIARAVVHLAGGRQRTGDRLGRDVGRGRRIGSKDVVTRIQARQRPTNVHRLAVADVLVRERTGGRQADNAAQEHTRDAALGRSPA